MTTQFLFERALLEGEVGDCGRWGEDGLDETFRFRQPTDDWSWSERVTFTSCAASSSASINTS